MNDAVAPIAIIDPNFPCLSRTRVESATFVTFDSPASSSGAELPWSLT